MCQTVLTDITGDWWHYVQLLVHARSILNSLLVLWVTSKHTYHSAQWSWSESRSGRSICLFIHYLPDRPNTVDRKFDLAFLSTDLSWTNWLFLSLILLILLLPLCLLPLHWPGTSWLFLYLPLLLLPTPLLLLHWTGTSCIVLYSTI